MVDATHYISLYWDGATKQFKLYRLEGATEETDASAVQWFNRTSSFKIALAVDASGATVSLVNGAAAETLSVGAVTGMVSGTVTVKAGDLNGANLMPLATADHRILPSLASAMLLNANAVRRKTRLTVEAGA